MVHRELSRATNRVRSRSGGVRLAAWTVLGGWARLRRRLSPFEELNCCQQDAALRVLRIRLWKPRKHATRTL